MTVDISLTQLRTNSRSKMGDRMIGRFTESALLAKAKEVVEEKSKASSIFDEDAEKALPRFKMSGESSAQYGLCP